MDIKLKKISTILVNVESTCFKINFVARMIDQIKLYYN